MVDERQVNEETDGELERLRLIYEHSPLGMGFISVDGVLTDCNDALATLFGASRKELIGSTMKTGIIDEGIAVAIAKAFSGMTGVFEGDYTPPGRSKIMLRTIHAPLTSRNGDLKGVLFVAEDVSERKHMEDLLREGERRYQAIVESQAEFVVRYLPGGTITFVNDTFCRYANMKREDLLGRSCYPFIHPDDREEFIRRIEALDRKTPDLVAEARVVLSDGRVTWHRCSHHAIFDGAGRLAEYQCTGRDVTELKLAEDRLRESEERYRQLFEAESDAIFLIDNETSRILMANTAAAVLYGYREEELLEKKNTDLSAEPSETRRVTEETPVLKDNVVVIPLRYHRKKDGTVFPVEITGRFFTYQGRPVHIAAIRDITDRKKAENDAAEREALLQQILDTSSVAIFLVDKEGRITHANRRMTEMFGHAMDDLVGREYVELVHPSEREAGRRKMLALLASEISSVDLERHYWRKDGTEFWGHLAGRRFHDVRGNELGLIGVISDISERKRAEEALRDSRRFLEAIIESAPT